MSATRNTKRRCEIGPVREAEASYGGPGGEIVLYHAPDGTVSLNVRLERETLWLDAHQMAALFGRDRSVILRHIRNIYATNELDPSSTCAKNAQVAADGKVREMDCYNLDVIISVGYRVNSKRGTQFRIWATQVLRDHILKGYTINERRLHDLNQAVRLIVRVARRQELQSHEASALLQVVSEYSFALDVLDDYDCQRLPAPSATGGEAKVISLGEARRIAVELRRQ